MTTIDRDGLPLTLLGIALAITLAFGLCWWPYTIDDAFIFYRYAVHFASGHGPVFNLGERVEGYSSVLWMAFLAAGRGAGLDPEIASKVTGIACAIALVALLYAALVRAGCSPVIAALPSAWLAGFPGLHIFSCSGMETVPYALAVAAAALVPALRLPPRAGNVLLATGLFAVWGLRPEGVFPALAVTIAIVLAREQRALARGLAIGWLAIAATAAAKFAYYGALVPNTFLAKPSPLEVALTGGGAGVIPALANQFFHVGTHLSAWGGIPLLGLAVFAALDGARGATARPALAAVAGGMVFLFYAPPDWTLEHRFALPYVAPLLFAAALGLDFLCAHLPRASWRPVRVAFLGGTALWLALGMVSSARLLREYGAGGVNPALNGHLYAEMGRWLRAHAAPGDRVLAYEVGAVGYVSDLYVIDHEGLVTRETVATLRRAGGYRRVRGGSDPEAMRHVVATCTALRPNWFLVRSLTSEAGRLAIGSPVPPSAATERIQQALLERLGGTMVLVRVFPLAPDDVESRECYLLLHGS